MVDVNVEFTLGNENPIDAEFTLEPDVTYLANIVMASFSGDHNQLVHRDYPDQHPIESITGLTEGLNNLSSAIDNETERAENAENILNGKIDDEVSRAILAEGSLSDRITSEVTRATAKENQLADDIQAENTRALSAEETLQDNIDAEETRAKNAENELSSSIDSNHQAISNHVADKNNPHEVTKTQVGLGNVENLSPANMPISSATQTALNTKVDKVSTANKVYGTDASGNQTTYDKGTFGQVDDVRVGGTSVVTNKIADLGTMAGESSNDYYTSSQIDTALAGKQNTIDDLSNIRADSQDGKTAYDTIQTYGDIVTHDVDEFATAAQGVKADTALQPNDNISELANDVGYITAASLPAVNNGTLAIQKNGTQIATFTANQSGNTTANIIVPTTTNELTNNSDFQTGTQVANSIADETTARENADNNLQNQIDAITSSSDVTDIVGTYAQLQAYDTSTLPPNSIIKVLQDENRNNETTYYRWVVTGGVGSWVLIGEEGPYYTKSEANTTFVPQTRTVNNKALSNDITLTASDVGALPSSTIIPTVDQTYNSASTNAQSGTAVAQALTSKLSLVNNTEVSVTAEGITFYTGTNNFNIHSYDDINEFSFNYGSGTFGFFGGALVINTPFANNIDITTNGSDVNFDLPGYKLKVNGSEVATTSQIPTNYVTTDTEQNISSRKTFLGEKAIYFKQIAAANKLGFTLYNTGNTEVGAFEYRPNTINGGALLNVNCSYSSTGWVGFRYWGTAVNIIAPKVATAGNYYIPVNITNGTNTVTATNAGTVDISTLLPAAQVNSDWNANSGVAQILNKPTIPTMTYNSATKTLTWS